ncbi:PREDICTED: uncharacterized protein LOC108445928 isoform X1 [Corvus brachyrhynchos]|uniref:uncharacterized protein LOC108445928 isoform X1 n=1 Tax=Corvus brachyrhynchos TaxID=85066 RepID=UPI0008167977|nr:PREDICTED: uncharacterized protein LOC108445928 isoform X1 [Corvus brachyrhynchos]
MATLCSVCQGCSSNRSSSSSTFFFQIPNTTASEILNGAFKLQGDSAHPADSGSHGEQRLMKDGSELGVWRAQGAAGEQNEEKQLKKGKLILWWAVRSKRTFGSARCLTRSENLTMAAQGRMFRKRGCPTAAKWKGEPDFRKIAACLPSPMRLNPSTPDCRDCLGLVTSPAKRVGASKQSGSSTAWLREPKIGLLGHENDGTGKTEVQLDHSRSRPVGKAPSGTRRALTRGAKSRRSARYLTFVTSNGTGIIHLARLRISETSHVSQPPVARNKTKFFLFLVWKLLTARYLLLGLSSHCSHPTAGACAQQVLLQEPSAGTTPQALLHLPEIGGRT